MARSARPGTSDAERPARPRIPRTLASTTRKFQIELELPDGSTTAISCGADEHVLDAARRAGLTLPSLCEQGWDLACAVRVLAGKLDHADARRYYAADEQAGFALICTAKPLTDLKLRTFQTAAMREHRNRHGLPAPRGT